MEKEAIQKPFSRKQSGAPKKQLQQLPEDVIEDILSRLPVISLLRFRSVCKQWNTLISSSRRFVSMHLKRSLSNPTMHSIINIHPFSEDGRHPLVYLNPVDLAPLTSSHLDPYHPVVNPIDPRRPARVFVGSINGLVCIRSLPADWLGIWNPSTKTVRELMIPATNPDFYAVAFGWDPIANDHKVMRLCRSVSAGSGGWVEVCSVQGSSWRSFQMEELADILPMCTQNLIMGDGRTYSLVSRGRQTRFGDIVSYRGPQFFPVSSVVIAIHPRAISAIDHYPLEAQAHFQKIGFVDDPNLRLVVVDNGQIFARNILFFGVDKRVLNEFVNEFAYDLFLLFLSWDKHSDTLHTPHFNGFCGIKVLS